MSAPASDERTRPPGVWICTARMPGVPCGATHSTLTSSSGASTVSPSHSLTRCGSPAISRQARENAPSAPADGCSSPGVSHWMKKGSCGSAMQAVDADLLPAQLGAVGAVPVARDRRGGRGGPRRRLMSSTATTQPSQPPPSGGAGLHGLAERRLVGGRVVERLDDLEVGAVGERQGHVAGAEARVDAAVGELAPEQCPDALRRCRRGRRVRLRTRDGPGACSHSQHPFSRSDTGVAVS